MKPSAAADPNGREPAPADPILTRGLPSPDEELLLRAALLPSEAGVQAWREWNTRVDRERELPMASQLLFPLLHRNLSRLGCGEVRSGKTMGVCRRIWWANQTAFQALSDVLRIFRDAGIPTMLLKGTALTLRYYKDRGLRPMGDFDVQVPVERRRQAIELLTQAGWRSKNRTVARLTDAVLGVWHAQAFEDSRHRPVDLHWHTLSHHLTPDADQDFWAGAQPIDVDGIPSAVLNHTDQLIHVCVHGACAGAVIRVRWVADALTMLREEGEVVDWSRLLDVAVRRRLTLPLRRALGYLRERFDVPVPEHVLREMAAVRVSDRERAYYAAVLTDPAGLWGGGLHLCWCRHRLDLERRGVTRGAASWLGFPRFLQNRQILSNRELLGWVVSRSYTRFVRGAERRIRP